MTERVFHFYGSASLPLQTAPSSWSTSPFLWHAPPSRPVIMANKADRADTADWAGKGWIRYRIQEHPPLHSKEDTLGMKGGGRITTGNIRGAFPRFCPAFSGKIHAKFPPRFSGCILRPTARSFVLSRIFLFELYRLSPPINDTVPRQVSSALGPRRRPRPPEPLLLFPCGPTRGGLSLAGVDATPTPSMVLGLPNNPPPPMVRVPLWCQQTNKQFPPPPTIRPPPVSTPPPLVPPRCG